MAAEPVADRQVVAVEILAGEGRPFPALEREGLARHGQAALGLLVLVRVSWCRLARDHVRIDDDPTLGDAVGIAHLPGEDAQAHPDLGGGQSDSAGRVHRLEHVRDQRADLVVDDGDGFGAAVQDGFAGDDDGADGHGRKSVRASRWSQPTPSRHRLISSVLGDRLGPEVGPPGRTWKEGGVCGFSR